MSRSFRSPSPACLILIGLSAGCGGSGEDEPITTTTTTVTSGTGGAGGSDPCAGTCPASAIRHVVVVVQENHSFDNHFGRYCQAPAGSNPTCTTGPSCCERGPDTDPGTNQAPVVLDDAAHGSYDPVHSSACELAEMNGGAMDRFVSAACGDIRNFAYAPQAIMQPYWDLAATGALADRYFQAVAGASSANDMYFARAGFVFADNSFEPAGAPGAVCTGVPLHSYTDPTLGDLLTAAGVSWAFYAEGYDAMAALGGGCPLAAPPECPAGVPHYPCVFDPGDIPFLYYTALLEDPSWMRDYTRFATDLAQGRLPAVSFVKAIGFRTEHPGSGTALSTGIAFTSALVAAIGATSYAADTLIVLAYDESGGYFDHVSPPANNPVDHQPYGPRIPFLALGPFARSGAISHVPLEHASLVRFIEWNWLGQTTGQLGQRDTNAGDIGSLLDPAATGIPVP